jgi:hypothetical protein
MRRLALLFAVSLMATVAVVPTANAAHVGPCWHEYAEAVLWFALDHRSAKQLGSDVGGCIDGTVYFVCHNPWFICTLS